MGIESEQESTGGSGSGKLLTGVAERTYGAKALGFSSHARTGGMWFLGYPDGSIWKGIDPRLASAGKASELIPNPALRVYRGEFVFGNMHSSDGTRWNPLGAAFSVRACHCASDKMP